MNLFDEAPSDATVFEDLRGYLTGGREALIGLLRCLHLVEERRLYLQKGTTFAVRLLSSFGLFGVRVVAPRDGFAAHRPQSCRSVWLAPRSPSPYRAGQAAELRQEGAASRPVGMAAAYRRQERQRDRGAPGAPRQASA